MMNKPSLIVEYLYETLIAALPGKVPEGSPLQKILISGCERVAAGEDPEIVFSQIAAIVQSRAGQWEHTKPLGSAGNN